MIKRIPRRIAVTLAILSLSLGIPLGVSLASHQFSDVPNSNIFHADIEAIANAGVTTGCGGGRYCPSDFVTREQMAAFMNRLGALDSRKIPVVNADKIDGADSSAFERPLFAVVNADGSLARGNGASTSGRVLIDGPGSYQVFFNRSVDSCAFNLTVGSSGSSGPPDSGFGNVMGVGSGSGVVNVRTFSTTGVPSDRGFHLEITCPGHTGLP